MSDDQLYETAQLTDEFAGRILDNVSTVENFSLAESTESAVTKIRRGAMVRNGVTVAEGYRDLKQVLEGGTEDDSMMGAPVMNGRKKAAFQDLQTVAGTVYGFVFDEASLRNVPASTVFAETERA